VSEYQSTVEQGARRLIRMREACPDRPRAVLEEAHAIAWFERRAREIAGTKWDQRTWVERVLRRMAKLLEEQAAAEEQAS
jgi:hypothetical protein